MDCHVQHAGQQSTVLSQAWRHNQLAAVFRLPFEVLAEVFGLLQTRTDYAWDDLETLYHSSLLWIPEATHVCHTWRTVALNTAVLWRDIDVTASPSWAIEFARRSRNVPLRISASTSEFQKKKPIVRECVEQLIRASVERVETIVLDRIFDVGSILSSPSNERVTFPILRYLEVATLEEFILTESSLNAPLLEGLEVRDLCSVDWKAFSLFQNLSYLDISPIFDTSLSDLGAIYRALCQMPNLTDLILYPDNSNIGPEAVVMPPTPCQPVSLPKLRRMHLGTFFPLWLSILHSIAYGPQRDLVINATCNDATDVKELFSNIPSIMQHVKELDIRSLQIYLGTGQIRFRGSHPLEKDETLHKGSVDISICMPTWLRPLSSYPFGLNVYLLNKLVRRVHLQHLRWLTLSLQEPVPATTWVCLFGGLPDLLMVDIQSGLRELCAALVNDIEDAPDRDTIPFRALQSITVRGEKGPCSDKDIDYMRGCLKKRLELKVPLRKLRIKFDNDVKGHSGMLKELMEFVVGTTMYSS